MATLAFNEGDAARRVDVPDGGDGLTIGRQVGNALTLRDTNVSRFHCVVEYRRGVLGVRDLGSRNGTLVNGETVDGKGRRLKAGDTLTVGGTALVVEDRDAGKKPVALADVSAGTTQGAGVDAADAARGLAHLAGGLPDRDVQSHDLRLLNARGKAIDAAGGEVTGDAVTVLRLTLLVCFRTGASDIHLEPGADGYALRVRVDGVMTDVARLTKPAGTKLATLVKVLGDIDIAKTGVVQEGSFACRVPDRRVDYRLSFTPGLYGQKLVIRVLDAANAPQYLWDLGLPEHDFESLDRLTRRSEGMLLVCGPTGSGKSSTLYSVLRSIDAGERNVVTIEDPVEIRLDGITQQPVNDKQGNTFAALLRSVLRQDPDVILVGEIRDNETALAAAQAAMTGHLVLSTVHSRDTISAVFRLLDLGVEPYQVSSGLSAVIAQRLVRRLCPHCRRMRPATKADLRVIEEFLGREPDDPDAPLYDAVGCAKCLGTGYAGRQAVFEVLHVSPKVREALLGGGDAASLHRTLAGTGYVSLRSAAVTLALSGETTLAEADKLG